MDNQRNIIIAVVLSLALMLGFDFVMGRIYPQPTETEQTQQAAVSQDVGQAPSAKATAKHIRDGGLADPAEQAEEVRDLTTALASTARVKIDAPEVAGTINPVGARLDDVVLKSHRQTVAKNSGPVRMFSPAGTPAQQFAQFGWVGEGVAVPGPQTVWQVAGGSLTQASPVTLSWNNGQGQTFSIRYSIDDHYMMTVEQRVVNAAAGPVVVRPYGSINRTSRTASQDTWNVHSGPIGNFGGSVDFGTNYADLDEDGPVNPEGRTNWVGFTDIYWLSAMIPQPGVAANGGFRAMGNETYRADMLYDPVTLKPGTQVARTSRLFVGAKESATLNAYEEAGVNNFGLAIDWGWFRWVMYPIFALLRSLYSITGNFGVAIILLTVIVRGVMFPVAQKQFASMAAMRAVQPKMKALQERYKDDKPKLQGEMAKLYKDEGVNPLAGCLPIFLQIPIFFALYKTLQVAIEMRHKPFALWIKDLSAPDPATILNGFGLLDFTPPSFLAIGVLAVLLGLTMWLQFKLNPAALDPVQQQVFSIMPWMLMFVMAPFAAGLLLYWITSNILTLGQQKYLYSRHPQLQAATDKEAADKARAAARDGK